MSPEEDPAAAEHVEASEPDVPELDDRLEQEEPEPGAAPGETVESIVEDLKRERGQS